MKKGFTIVELLAVVAILSIVMLLGGIGVFSIVGKVKENALKEGLSSLNDASIAYLEHKLASCQSEPASTRICRLSSCSSTFDPENPINQAGSTCYINVRVNTLISEKYFDSNGLKCDNNNIIVYRKGNEYVSYIPDNTCTNK